MPQPWAWLGCVGRDLLGGRGLGRASVTWAVVLLLAGMAFETGLGLLVLVVAAMTALVVVALRVPGSSAFGLVVMVASLVVGVAAFGYTWWAFGVGFDAADAGRPVPAWTGHLGAAVITMAGCAATFLVAAIVAVRRGTTTP